MKVIKSDYLPQLPDSVKELVLDGIYGLFSVSQDGAGGEYAVVIGEQDTAYLLGHEGQVVRVLKGEDYSHLDLREALTFSGVDSTALRVNALF